MLSLYSTYFRKTSLDAAHIEKHCGNTWQGVILKLVFSILLCLRALGRVPQHTNAHSPDNYRLLQYSVLRRNRLKSICQPTRRIQKDPRPPLESPWEDALRPISHFFDRVIFGRYIINKSKNTGDIKMCRPSLDASFWDDSNGGLGSFWIFLVDWQIDFMYSCLP